MIFAAPDETIWVGALRLALELPASRSLKDKRRVISRLRDRLRARHHLSLAEVGHREDLRRSVVALTAVSGDQRYLRSMLDSLADELPDWIEAAVVDSDIEVVRFFDGWGP